MQPFQPLLLCVALLAASFAKMQSHDGAGQPKFQIFAGLKFQFPLGR